MNITLKLDLDNLDIDEDIKADLRDNINSIIQELVEKEIRKDPVILSLVKEIKQGLVGGLTVKKT